MTIGISKQLLLASTALGLAAPAFAQDTPGDQSGTPTPAGTGQSAASSTNAPAQAPTEAVATRTSDGDIVVTARRVEERLQDVPISITVLNQQQISDRNIVSSGDLATYTPSLTVNSRFGAENTTFAIRGFTQENFTTPSVAVYFADVVAPRAQGGTAGGNGGGVGSFFDLQNVQVLRGPQGTLFGRNTTGGAVLLVPQKPTSRFEGYVEGSIGNYDLRRLQGVINIPIGETVRLRVGADRQKVDGYLRNRSGVGPKDFNDTDYLAVRASLVIDVTPDVENYTIASYNDSDTNGSQVRLFATNTGPNCAPRFDRGLVTSIVGPLVCSQQLARQTARGDSLYDVENDVANPRQHIRQFQVINTTTWRASDSITIKNIASYSRFKQSQTSNIFGTNLVVPARFNLSALLPPAIPAILRENASTGANAGRPFSYVSLFSDNGRNNIQQYTYTEELQLQGQAGDGKLVYQLGGYYEHSGPIGSDFQGTRSPILISCTDTLSAQCTDVLGASLAGVLRLIGALPAGAPNPTIGQIQNSLTRYKFDNIGFYGQATYNLTDQLAITGGLRYTIDKVSADGATRGFRFPTPNVPVITCSNPPAGRDGTIEANCSTRQKIKTEDPTWLIDLDYKPIDDLLIYGKWSRGYRQGSINASNTIANAWGPESVDAYEIGAKFSFSGAVAGYFNVAAFYNDIKDQQLNATLNPINPATASPAQGIVNAGKARIKGIEVDAALSPVTGLNLNVGYAYLDTELREYDVTAIPANLAAVYTVIPGSNEGDPLPFAPKHRVTVTANYTLPLDESIGQVTFGGTYTYTSKQQQFPLTATPFGIIQSTELLNLNLNWNKVAGSPVDLQLFATNVTKEKYISNVGNGFNTAGYEYGTVGAPRMYGARVKVRFGQ